MFQEFNLLPDRTVAENIYLGREPRRGLLVNKTLMNSQTAELLDSLGIAAIRPSTQVRSLTVAEQQIVEIAKAVSYDARIISMDEPTAALAGAEVGLLYEIVARLRERGTAILYVSHRLREVFDLCDVITVLKDGKVVSTLPASELDDAQLVRLMVGRPISAFFPDKLPREDVDADGPRRSRSSSCKAPETASWTGSASASSPGEIVGLAGLQGSGRTELLHGIFGAAPFTRGTMKMAGGELLPKSPRQGVRARMALITEDRKAEGLSLNQSILDNALSVIRSVFPRRTGSRQDRNPGRILLPRGYRPGPGPGGAVPVGRQPAKSGPRQVAGYPPPARPAG